MVPVRVDSWGRGRGRVDGRDRGHACIGDHVDVPYQIFIKLLTTSVFNLIASSLKQESCRSQ